MSWRLGIDLGGSKIEAALLDAGGKVQWRHRIATPQGNYTGTLDAIEQLVAQARDHTAAQQMPPPSIGIGTPGAVSLKTGRMKNCNSTCLNGQTLQRDLQSRLGQSIKLANDADCMTLSEATDGAGAGQPIVFGVILGTGVGGGIVANGRLLDGPNRICGEWGHNPLPYTDASERDLRPCYCGRSGCVETFLSGPGLAHTYQQLARQELTPEQIVAQQSQNADAKRAFEIYLDQLARALANVINLLDPHCIVLAGGLSNIATLYAQIPQRWLPYVFSDQVNTQLKPARHGDASGVRGAAWLWDSESPIDAKSV